MRRVFMSGDGFPTPRTNASVAPAVVVDPVGSRTVTDALTQVGWWIPDEFAPERMSKREWESERLVTLWMVEDEGGFAGEWAQRAIPVYIKSGEQRQ